MFEKYKKVYKADYEKWYKENVVRSQFRDIEMV